MHLKLLRVSVCLSIVRGSAEGSLCSWQTVVHDWDQTQYGTQAALMLCIGIYLPCCSQKCYPGWSACLDNT
jgi:hypothetical protein